MSTSSSLTAQNASNIMRNATIPHGMVVNILIGKIEHSIKLHASHHQSKCTYRIPYIMLGMPAYDIKNIIRRLKKHFRERGFKVKILFVQQQYYIHLSWRKFCGDDSKHDLVRMRHILKSSCDGKVRKRLNIANGAIKTIRIS